MLPAIFSLLFRASRAVFAKFVFTSHRRRYADAAEPAAR
jgi:hypothetical protein